MRATTRQLEYLCTLAETLNFRRAAEQSHISQPALSKQIQELEALLGATLFERNKRRVLLTPLGKQIVARAHIVLRGLDDINAIAQSKSAPLSTTLKLGVIPTIAPYLLPQWMPTFSASYPDCELFLIEDQTNHLLKRLADGEIDLLILALEVELGSVETLPLFKDEFSFVVPQTHPLAKRRSVPIASIANEPILLLEEGHCLRDQALDVCRIANAKEVADFRASSLNTLIQMVAHGGGVTLLPEMAIQSEMQRAHALVPLHFFRPSPFRTIGLVWRPSSPRKEEFMLIADIITQAVSPQTLHKR